MVRQGDFEITLVHADSKEPFKEHTKDGKVYVEVEPNAEYFICMKRLGNAAQGAFLAYPAVDGESLGYHKVFPKVSRSTKICGLWTCNGGTSTHRALKFTKPRLAQGGVIKSQLLMGKVKVNIYKGILNGYKDSSSKSHQSTWNESDIDQAQAGSLAKKKGLRSGEGSVTIDKQEHGKYKSFKKGGKVDVFTLNYCAAMGLIEVGVLPKPPLWVHHRMMHPAKKRDAAAAAAVESTTTSTTTTTTTTTAPIIRPTKMIRSQVQENALFDLSNVNDDSDDDDE